MDRISFTEFKKLRLKVAEIKEAAEHPDADKLLILKIDSGENTRQIVAGIRGHYSAGELIGKQIVIVENLEPAVIRGVKSEGMLLAAHDGERVVLLGVDKPVKPGASIS